MHTAKNHRTFSEQRTSEQTEGLAMDFKQSLAYASKHDPAHQAEVITLNEYIDRVSERPTIAATAHERIYDMIRAAGFSDGHHAGEVSHGFFRERAVRTRRPARSARAHLRDGRPGSSDTPADPAAVGTTRGRKELRGGAAQARPRGLVSHRRWRRLRAAGLPDARRAAASGPGRAACPGAGAHATSVEGKTCPVCSWRLEHRVRWRLPRTSRSSGSYFSEATRIGIGTFEPGDPKSMSMEQLTGGLDFQRNRDSWLRRSPVGT